MACTKGWIYLTITQEGRFVRLAQTRLRHFPKRLCPSWAISGCPGPYRVLCGDATNAEVIARLLGERKPRLMTTDPPYGISLDSEWRDRAGLNGHGPAYPSYMKKRSEGHTETISGDTRADWFEAFALVPSLDVAYVRHASRFTREVLDGLLRIGSLHDQQIIWNKGRTVLTRTHCWFQYEPRWYVRKKNAAWFGKAGENSTMGFAISDFHHGQLG